MKLIVDKYSTDLIVTDFDNSKLKKLLIVKLISNEVFPYYKLLPNYLKIKLFVIIAIIFITTLLNYLVLLF